MRTPRTLTAVASLLIVVVGCGGSAPTSPGGDGTPLAPNPCPQSQSCPSIDSIGFWIRIQANTSGEPGPWSFTFNAKDYTGPGNKEFGFINALPGDYEITGLFSTTTFIVELGRQGGGRGGVVVSSVQSLQGPTTTANPCTVVYFTQAARTAPQPFRVKFTVVAGTNGTC